jgi:V8-like Glu-specific endopeptidase
VATLVLFATVPAAAFPIGTPKDAPDWLRPAPSEDELDAAAVDFTAIVALSNCSGSLVRYTNSQPTDKALVLTNGHCTGGFIDAGNALAHVPSSRTFSLLAKSGRTKLGTLQASELIYATMTGSDFALYRLTQTNAQLTARYGVTPLTIADTHPAAGAPIRVVSGYWRKIYSCAVDRFVYQLREATWTFTDSLLYSTPGCETIPGTSGSPIIHATTHAIIGINNTGNESGGHCTLDNPCEVDEHGTVVVTKGASYGQQLYQLYTCLDATNELNLDHPGCKLNKPL